MDKKISYGYLDMAKMVIIHPSCLFILILLHIAPFLDYFDHIKTKYSSSTSLLGYFDGAQFWGSFG